jgi:polar amino acid transport system substrate-binding protein
MPDGILAEIYDRDSLRVGVDQNTLGFGWRDREGDLNGFDISLARAIGEAIFGEDGHVELIPVTSPERIDAVEDGHVDMVISLFSITCSRAGQVAFSAEYFRAHQRVLVPRESGIDRVEDLNGRTVCATSRSTSLENLARFAPHAIPYEVPSRTDCLVALQQGVVDAISTDDTILLGFMAQDPKLVLVPETEEPLSDEQYGIAIKLDPEHEDLVRFVNGVLEQVATDGRWHEFVAEAEAELNRRPGRHVEIEADEPPVRSYRDET